MSIESVKAYLEPFGLAGRVIEFDASSATVAEAAADLGYGTREYELIEL